MLHVVEKLGCLLQRLEVLAAGHVDNEDVDGDQNRCKNKEADHESSLDGCNFFWRKILELSESHGKNPIGQKQQQNACGDQQRIDKHFDFRT